MTKQIVSATGGTLPADGPGPDEQILSMVFEAGQLYARADEIMRTRVEPAEKALDDAWAPLKARGMSLNTEVGSAEYLKLSCETGYDDAVDEQGDLNGKALMLLEQAFVIPAKTNAGRAAKARAWLEHMTDHRWEKNLEMHDSGPISLIEILSEYCGVSPLSLGMGYLTIEEQNDEFRRRFPDREQRTA